MPKSQILIFISCLAAAMQAFAASATQPQVDQLKATTVDVLDAIYADSAESLSKEEKQARVRAVLEKNYDLDVIIRRAIGRNWRQLDSSQQEKVLELVKQLVVKAYVDNMNGRERPEVRFDEAIQISDKRMEVPSTVTSEGTSVSVLYRLGRLRSGWQIYDVVAENISVVANFRQQIDDHFRKGSAEGLIERLEELLNKEKITDETLQL
ncbi:MAG: phospholipid-binding protein MlaC [Opitutales bacterium]